MRLFSGIVVLLISGSLFSQNSGSLQGRVLDSNLSLPLSGANVIIEGTSTGVVTDEEGFFEINSRIY